MKLCHLTNTYRPHVGGVARSVETLTGECRRMGHEVLVVAPGFPGDHHERDRGVLRVPAIQRFNGSDFSVRVPVPHLVRQRIRRFRPDVLHSHHPFLMGDTALRMAGEYNRPLVFTHHTLYENYTHYVPFDSPALRRLAIELATAYANACDAVIAPSRSVAALIARRGVETPVRVIPTGIDAAALAAGQGARFRADHGIARDAIVLGHVGRLAPEKNLRFLAGAMADALGRAPRAHGVIVGDGPEGPAVKAAFAEAGVTDRLVMTGKLGGQSLLDAYAAMDLFVFCSRTETQGMVLAEAMAAGTPVIALDGPGVRDVVEDDGNGRLLAEDCARGELAEVLAGAIDDAAARARWGRAAARTGRRFDRERCAREVVALYESLERERRADGGEWHWWDALRGRIEAEWALIAAKAESAGKGLGGSRRRGSTNSNDY